MFQFCMDRGAGHQLEDVRKSTYGPWKREIERIFKEEMMHVNHGDYWVKKYPSIISQGTKFRQLSIDGIRGP